MKDTRYALDGVLIYSAGNPGMKFSAQSSLREEKRPKPSIPGIDKLIKRGNTMTLQYKYNPKTLLRCAIPAAAGLILSACNMQANQAFNDGIGYREARFAEISAMREYRQCRDDALNLDTQARKEGSSARYLSSARLIEKCEAEVAASAAKAGENERMRAYALSIQNYFKGGDIAKAQQNLENLKTAFPGKDLYFPDGSSFVETMEVLLGMKDRSSIGQFSAVNVNQGLKAELRRVDYWKKN